MIIKALLFIPIIGIALPAQAAIYFGNTCTSQAINGGTCTWNTTSTGSCTATGGTTLTWPPAAGDTLYANGCTGISLVTDPGVNGTVTISTVGTGGTAGGTFTCVTTTGTPTITANIQGGPTSASGLTISGAAGTGCNTINGNVTGGTGAGGINDTHTVATVTVTGNVTGGTGTNTAGWGFSGATGSAHLIGNATAAAANAYGISVTGAGSLTVSGDCIGSDTTTTPGCANTGTGSMTVTGSLIAGLRGAPATGSLLYNPAATEYVLYPKNSSYVTGTVNANATEMPFDPGAANVLSGTTYGSFTGSLVCGAGGILACTGGWR